MATVKSFAALRPAPELARRICELPYDVMSSDEARLIAARNPLSFFHVSKPEVDLERGANPCAPEVYAKGRDNFQRLIRQGALRRDPKPVFYLYRQVQGDHKQVGLVATANCQEYLDGTVRKHELTRPDKEDDRVRHIEALDAQTGPVFLVYRAVPALDALVGGITQGEPDVDFTAEDGVRHSSWMVGDAPDIRFIETQFARIPLLYIADGHHRSAAAARIFQKRGGAGGSAGFLSVIFPHDQARILPYNRVLKDLNGLTPPQLLERFGSVFSIHPGGTGSPASKNELGFFIGGRWFTLRFHPKLAAVSDPVEQLDVSLLQKHALGPIFGIQDPRTSRKISFVGGIRGTMELEKLVNQDQYACAFSLYPTGVEDLMAVADAEGVLPPKSTWFEPKLRDAMFCHML